MQLNQVNIENFRNITSASYDLKKVNMLVGPNMQGKTNTILAIYWALSDYLLDGSSDYPSFKPHSDLAETVSVELVFDDFKVKKTYAEKWTKTRGSNEVTLTGHTTEYFIDEVKYSVGEGKKELLNKLGLSDVKTTSKADVLRAIIDPYYLATTLKWQDLRTFIIDLVGDVDDQSVLNSKDEFVIIFEDLKKYKFDFSTLTKLYKQNIKKNSDEIVTQENFITGYKEIKDVNPAELSKAVKQIDSIDEKIADLRIQKKTAINPLIAPLEAQVTDLQVQYMDSAEADRKKLIELNAKANQTIDSLSKEITLATLKYEEKVKIQNEHRTKLQQYDSEMSRLQSEKKRKEDYKAELLQAWEELDAQEYVSNTEMQTCPHCGGLLNEEEVKKHQKQWELHKEKRLNDIVTQGTKLKNEIENINHQIVELEKNDVGLDPLTHTEIIKLGNILETKKAELNTARSSLAFDYKSDETAEIESKIAETKEQLEKEKQVQVNPDIFTSIDDLISEKNALNTVVSKHNTYLQVQENITDVGKKIKAMQEALINNETKLIMLEDFIKTKLTLLNKNVSSVFNEVEFVLVESNIKEGSYNETCYPLILGQQTPFTSGSGAEKITTGVYIIECVKRKLGLPNLPIIFDEADKLDTQTLANKLVTGSQIISTKVDDVNYEKVTMVAR